MATNVSRGSGRYPAAAHSSAVASERRWTAKPVRSCALTRAQTGFIQLADLKNDER